MGRLVGISFVGIDKNTDLKALEKLQAVTNKIEFGVIMSKNWFENGNRYFDPDDLKHLRGRGLNLSLHLCGSVAREAIKNNWEPAFDLLDGNADLFKRVQLNIKGYPSTNPKELDIMVPSPFNEVIIQQHAAYACRLYYEWFLKHLDDRSVTVLLDGSGGTGKNTPIIPLYRVPKVGYAGGISPDNVFKKTIGLLYSPVAHDFWLDMESGIRTDDWFDISKVRKVLEEVDKALEYDLDISQSRT